jgi:prepilin-type N-terminal cleavage/methylation domain-containing protein
MHKKPNNGFVLIELVTTLILIGVIGAFAGLFLYTGVNGFLASKRNSEAALVAQAALERISAELRFVSSLPAVPTNSSITYLNNDFPGIRRRLCYGTASKIIYLSVNAAESPPLCGDASENPWPLLDNAETFSLILNSSDMDNADGDQDPSTGSQEISSIFIEFTVTGVGPKFNVRIHPRVFIPIP